MEHYDYLYKDGSWEEGKEIKHRSDKTLGYKVMENVYFYYYKRYPCLFNSEEKYIPCTALGRDREVKFEVKEKEKVEFLDETVIYLGVLNNVYGHILTDSIKRLWFLSSKEYKEKYSKCKVVYLPLGNFKFNKNYIRFFELLGFNYKDFIPIKKTTQVKKVILADESFYNIENTRYYTKEYAETIEKVREYGRTHFTKLPYDKVYLSYRAYSKGKSIGEEKLEKFFKKLGYKVVSPERLTFDEQINLMQNVRFVASTDGSLLHNTLFCLPNKTTVYAIRRANYLTDYQQCINEVADLDTYYIDSQLSFLADKDSPWAGPHYYYVSDNLLKLFNCKVKNRFYYDTFKDFDKYIRQYKKRLLTDMIIKKKEKNEYIEDVPCYNFNVSPFYSALYKRLYLRAVQNKPSFKFFFRFYYILRKIKRRVIGKK